MKVNVDTDHLRELANRTTPGPWTYDAPTGRLLARDDILFPVGLAEDADLEFIAAANPEVVLALIEEIKRQALALEVIRDTPANGPSDMASAQELAADALAGEAVG